MANVPAGCWSSRCQGTFYFFKLPLFVKGSIFSPKLFKLWFPEVATDPDVCKEPLAAQEAMPSALREKVRDSF